MYVSLYTKQSQKRRERAIIKNQTKETKATVKCVARTGARAREQRSQGQPHNHTEWLQTET